MRKLVPVLIVIVLLGAISALYAPSWYRNFAFRRDVEAMLAAAKAGQPQAIASSALPAQQADVLSLLQQYLPSDYASKLAKLSLTTVQEVEGDPDSRWAIVTARIEDGDGMAVYQGKLLWRWSGKRWEWDFYGSYAAPMSLSGEPSWQGIDDVLPQAGGG